MRSGQFPISNPYLPGNPALLAAGLLATSSALAIDGPLTPEQSLQYLKTEPGLKVELVAAEPLHLAREHRLDGHQPTFPHAAGIGESHEQTGFGRPDCLSKGRLKSRGRQFAQQLSTKATDSRACITSHQVQEP